MSKDIDELRFSLRCSQRMGQRTVRFYRRIQTVLTFFVLLTGCGTIAALAAQMLIPAAALLGSIVVFGCISMIIRPADKIATNMADIQKYGCLLCQALYLDAATLKQLLHEARKSDTAQLANLMQKLIGVLA